MLSKEIRVKSETIIAKINKDHSVSYPFQTKTVDQRYKYNYRQQNPGIDDSAWKPLFCS